MSNLNSNPLFIDGALTAATWIAKFPSPVSVRLIQWVDDNGDLAHDSTITLVINKVSLVVKIQPLASELAFGGTAWQIGPFSPGISVSELAVGAMLTGNLHIWI